MKYHILTHGNDQKIELCRVIENGTTITLNGRLSRCTDLIEMASGGIFDSNKLKECNGVFGGPTSIRIDDRQFEGCKWISVKHTESCSCCCWGEAIFTYDKWYAVIE